jgi:hypothetical protein
MNEEKRPLLTKEQAFMAGSTLLASGVLDVATHFDGLALFAGAAGVFLAYRHGSDVLDHFVPGRHNAQALEATAHFVDAVAAQPEGLDQSAPAKLRRLVGLKTPRKSSKGETDIEPIEPLQPRHFDFTDKDDLAAPTFAPSGPLYFSQVLRTFTPSLDKIYLGTLPDGTPVFVKARNLCHTALAGATRGGKDHLIRQLMSQLCFAGAKVYLLNPNYTRYDLESVDPYGRPYAEDWTPFESWLKNDPREMIPRDRKYQVIEHYLKSAYDMVERRMEKYGYSEQLGAPQFLFVNEIPAIVDEVPHTATYLKKILREGAKVGVFMVNASQDFQVTTVFKEIGGGVRKCYRTAIDVGSDPATQNALGLPVAKGLGKGNVSLRCDAVLSAARAPYVDNDALYALLGPSTYTPGAAHEQAEDELMSYMVSGQGYGEEEERHTDPMPQVAHHYHGHGAASVQQRRAEREQRLRSAAPVEVRRAEVAETPAPASMLSRDEQQVLNAYRSGLKTGNAIAAETRLSSTRVNQVLNKLSRMELIDWQPRKA